MTNKCCRCGPQPIDNFYVYGGKRDSYCKGCRVIVNREIRDRNPARHRLYHRKYKLERKYGLDVEQHAELIIAQGGKCAMEDCRVPLTVSCVDHNHETGEVRGLLCPQCNLRLGRYEALRSRSEAFDSYLSLPPARSTLGPRQSLAINSEE